MNTQSTLIVATSLLLAVGACTERNEPTSPAPPPAAGRRPVPAPASRTNPSAVRPPTDTPPAQTPSQIDDRIATEIRRLVTEDKSMSTAAQACRIAVAQGVVTLTGFVDTRAESDSIETKARSVEGVLRVDNRLEVKAPQ